jgi:hypothetical protein
MIARKRGVARITFTISAETRAAPTVLGRLFLRPGPWGTAANDLRLTPSSTSTNYPVIEEGQHPNRT